MEGYEVITSDEHKLGRVVGMVGDNLIVEHGAIFKSRHPLPKVFAHVDDERREVRVSVSKETLEQAPKAKGGEVDEQAVAEHYGLAAAVEGQGSPGRPIIR